MPLTLEEIELTIVELQEELRRAKKARTLLLKKSKQDARLANDLDKLLNKDSLDTKESSEARPQSSLPLVETIQQVNEEEQENISLNLVTEEPIVSNSQQPTSVGVLTELEAPSGYSPTLEPEERAEENIDKFF